VNEKRFWLNGPKAFNLIVDMIVFPLITKWLAKDRVLPGKRLPFVLQKVTFLCLAFIHIGMNLS